MKPSLIAAMLCVLGAAGQAWACSPPIRPIVTLPAGPDGKLTVMPPALDPNYPYIPPPNAGMCPTAARYANSASIPSLTDQEITDRLGGNLNTPPLAAGWLIDKVYNAGEKASFNARNYTAQWWTQGQQPDIPGGAWLEDADANGQQSWNASRAYVTGEKVVYGGKLYSAKWWSQNEQPGSNEWGAWELLGDPPPGIIDLSRLPGSFEVTTSKVNGELTLYFNGARTVDIFYAANGLCSSETLPPRNWPVHADRWEVHVDGVKVADNPLPPAVQTGNAPNSVSSANPDGSCKPQGTILATIGKITTQQYVSTHLPAGTSRFVSVWACKGTQCRPTKLLDHSLMGQSSGVPPIYVSP
ncbi:hypothetical protein IGB42_00303 [Andreprevotia sp. IGB-42]|uniref:carbohydrate-binding protein n=1 Tax=Andreprevotia sp. IGB-42 TaxID=2497473 RepID=UPI001356D6CC|nr:carbohydrate-binding protein [Andreprevotia sp. IGB-42]KAF0815225.1 hypothetical protein IGB42_00303 [Andreprevotia sp. IGB-42]